MRVLVFRAMFLLTVFLIGCKVAISQDQVSFTYDATGNRETRSMIVEQLKSASLNDSIFVQDDLELGNGNVKDNMLSEDLSSTLLGKSIKVYPNPTSGALKVDVAGNVKNGLLMIYSIKGSLIVKKPVHTGVTNIDLTKHPAGVYLMKVNIDGKLSDWKIIKE
ncbi:T9SS type A sorting domain-containing protein [Puteibacter caeruleilacunae]|nr:T9SS type A sorting domain-containing protein [Puteibacter caeruleilacunae]